ncbi:MAG: hypothetical protein ACRDYB_01440 [Acidimicrobiales bacterium]
MATVDVDDRGDSECPPSDPEAWSHEQWIAWLEATDDVGSPDPPGPVTSAGRITHSAGGQVLGPTMLALAQAMFGRRDDDVVVVAEAPGEGGSEGPYTVHLDRDHPERSTVVFHDVEPGPEAGEGPEHLY